MANKGTDQAPAPAPPSAQASIHAPQPEMREQANLRLERGDVAGARLWLSEAVAKGDAEAMFQLAETYDPDILARWRVVGLSSDPAKARDLYARAYAGGIEAAKERLDRLRH
jgi:TPR repeat protein